MGVYVSTAAVYHGGGVCRWACGWSNTAAAVNPTKPPHYLIPGTWYVNISLTHLEPQSRFGDKLLETASSPRRDCGSKRVRGTYVYTNIFIWYDSTYRSTLLGPQSSFGNKLLRIWAVSPQNETAVLNGHHLRYDNTPAGTNFRAEFLQNSPNLGEQSPQPNENGGFVKMSTSYFHQTHRSAHALLPLSRKSAAKHVRGGVVLYLRVILRIYVTRKCRYRVEAVLQEF